MNSPPPFHAHHKSKISHVFLFPAGESVYGEKRVSVEMPSTGDTKEKVEYRVWNPFRSKLAASILAGVDNIHIKPGAKVPATLPF